MRIKEKEGLDLTVVMPCLNEEQTVGHCVDAALQFMNKYKIAGEVLVVDNGSWDNSSKVAVRHGARVISEPRRGYGRAIRTGIAGSKGRIIVIGDADTTYDFLHLEKIYLPIAKSHCDMVIGNRYAGGIERGAMPPLHKLGVRFLSYLGRKRFGVSIYDFHCGLRAISRSAVERLRLHTVGMEFATELIAEAAREKIRMKQVPVRLRKCKFARKSKLRTIRDGVRHLRYITNWNNADSIKNRGRIYG